MKTLLLSVALACNLLLTVTALGDEIVRGADAFEFTYRIELPKIDGKAQLWAPLARNGRFQEVKSERVTAPFAWRRSTDASGANDTLVCAPPEAEAGGVIEIKYRVIRREAQPYDEPQPVQAFLRAERLVPNASIFQEITHKVTLGSSSPHAKAKALCSHVLDWMKYDKTGEGWGQGDALRACDVPTGNCTDFHSYFIALARASGVPARFAIGFSIPADKSEGIIPGYHCWAEFHAEGKWHPVDLSEAWKSPALRDYFLEQHPANRFELSRGRDLVLDPAPITGPVNFLIYPLLEIDGVPRPVKTEFTFRRERP